MYFVRTSAMIFLFFALTSSTSAFAPRELVSAVSSFLDETVHAPELTTNDYYTSKAIAVRASELAAVIYRSRNGIQFGETHEGRFYNGFQHNGLNTFGFFEGKTDVKLAVGVPSNGDKNAPVWLTFAGTHSSSDAVTDINVLSVNFVYGTGSVHRGFFNQYADGQNSFYPMLEQLRNQGYSKIAITGHSLGGALATLAAAHLSKTGLFSSVEVITFGAPMVGDAAFASDFDARLGKRSARFVNFVDVVPCMFQGASRVHVKNLMQFVNGKWYKDTMEVACYKDKLLNSWYYMSSHTMKEYLEAVKTLPADNCVQVWDVGCALASCRTACSGGKKSMRQERSDCWAGHRQFCCGMRCQ